MIFQENKYYKHETGAMIHTLQETDTFFYGKGIMAETDKCTYYPVGKEKENAVNWTEISKEEWESHFDNEV